MYGTFCVRLLVAAGLLTGSLVNPAQAAVPVPQAQATADANYQGVTPGPDAELDLGTAGGPPLAAHARSYQPVGGAAFGDLPYAFDDADARARALLPGTLGAYARAGGWSPGTGSGTGTFATATARTVTNWQVTGPAGSQTPVDVFAFYDGFLYVSSNSNLGNAPVTAEVDVALNLVTANSTTPVFEASGLLTLNPLLSPNQQPLYTTFGTLAGSSATAWENAWTQQSITLNGNDRLFELDYAEFFEDLFLVDNNTTWAFESVITVTASNQVGPFEIFATSDFYNTADTALSVDTAGASLVDLNPVPEPATVMLLAAAIVALPYRPRRS